MTSELWRHVKALFEAASELKGEQRDRFLESLSEPSEVTIELKRMLEGHDHVRGILDQPLIDISGPPPPQQQLRFQIGEVLVDRFRIERLLGVGGMGEVYEAMDLRLNDSIALKTPRIGVAGDEAVTRNFAREVRRARTVTHPNVCRIYDLFVSEGPFGIEWPFFTMELISGATLESRIQQNGSLSLEEALAILNDLCAGLQAAHSAGLFHGDLKPSNVILVNPPEQRAVITDFGLARQLEGTRVTQSSANGQIAGTLDYLSPEVMEGMPCTAASDVYALGLVAYEMITGNRPFPAAHPLFGAAMRLTQPPVSPRRFVPDLPANWEKAILHCLHRDPGRRPKRADDLLALIGGDQVSRPSVFLPSAMPRVYTRRSLIAGTVMATGSFGAFWVYYSRSKPPLRGGRPTILLAAFESDAEDRWKAEDFRYLLSISLEQSHVIRVFADSRRPRSRLTLPEACQIAMSHQVLYVVVGAVERLDDLFHLSARLIEASSQHVLGQFNQKVLRDGNLNGPSEKIASQVRLSLGESPESIRSDSRPLAQVTTNSMPALDRFVQAMYAYNIDGNYDDALSLLASAVQHDGAFATAFEYQAIIRSARGEDHLGLEPAERAYGLRGRTTERERLQIEAVYHVLRGDYQRSLDGYQSLVALYPDEAQTQRHLAHNYILVGNTRDALRCARRSTELAPHSVVNEVNLALVLLESEQPDDALRHLESLGLTERSDPIAGWALGLASLMKQDFGKAREIFETLSKTPGYENKGHQYLEACLLVQGELSKAVERLESRLAVDLARSFLPGEELRRFWLGQVYHLAGERVLAIAQARALLKRPDLPSNLLACRYASLIAGLSGEVALAEQSVTKLEAIYLHYPSTRSEGFLNQARGIRSSSMGEHRNARREFARANALWSDILSAFSLAECLHSVRDYQSAIEHYVDILLHKGTALRWNGIMCWLLSRVYAARCYTSIGQIQKGLALYNDFLYYWLDTSPKLSLVRQAFEERARLAKES
jgi:serine/threonine protein kinase/tetratricopeptide (TPR) repeat protein